MRPETITAAAWLIWVISWLGASQWSSPTVAVLATAAMRGTTLALAGALLMTAGSYIKARLDEHFLHAELGAEAYHTYVERVPMFLPFARR